MNYNSIRRKSREVSIGKVKIGGNNKIAIQSMTNTDTLDMEATLSQIKLLASSGCDIVRITVPDAEAAKTIKYIKESGIDTPIVADIHFDYRAALKSAEYGVDKIRINPGNIGDDSRVKMVADACRERNIPIRIGVNSGSLEKHILAKHGGPTPELAVAVIRFNRYLFGTDGKSVLAGDGETAFDTFSFALCLNNYRVDKLENLAGLCFDYYDSAKHTNLRACKTAAVCRAHSFNHVVKECKHSGSYFFYGAAHLL